MSHSLFPIVLVTLLTVGFAPAFGQEAFPEQMPMTVIAPVERVIPKTIDMKEALSSSADISLPVLSATESQDLFMDYAPLPRNRKVKIGIDRDVNVNGPSSAKSSLGKITRLKDGSVVWTLRIRSAEAKGIRVHFADCVLEPSAELAVYESPAEAVGPYTGMGPNGDGEFYTPIVFGEEVVVEYSAPSLPSTPPFQVIGISHIATNGEFKSDKILNCHNDITCFQNHAGYVYRSAIGLMAFNDGGSSYICSGSLLVDMDPNTYKPYFLTANHCIDNQAAATSLIVYWGYQTTSCNGTAPSLGSLPQSSGSTLLSTRATDLSDYCLLLLSQDPPLGTFFLGWNASDSLIGSSVYGIHHPDGSYKRISFGSITSQFPIFSSNPEIKSANYWSVKWTSGVTEGGSSGSPLIISGQVVGQLTGGNSDFPCTDPNSLDIYGRFSKTYPYISGYINQVVPTYTMTPTKTGTRTPTGTATATSTPTPTRTATNSATPSPTRSDTFTRTATATPTPTRTPTGTPTQTHTRTGTATRTGTPTHTGQPTPTETQTSSIGDQLFFYSINWNETPYGPINLIELLETL